MKFVIRVDGEEKSVSIEKTDGVFKVEIDGNAVEVDCVFFGDTGYMSMLIDNESYLIESGPRDASTGRYFARVMGRHYEVDVLDELLLAVRDAEEAAEHTGAHTVEAPMPGVIVEVKVAPGDHVDAGVPVVIMEAMKMQNELITEVAGVVSEVLVSPKDTVDSRVPLVRVERE